MEPELCPPSSEQYDLVLPETRCKQDEPSPTTPPTPPHPSPPPTHPSPPHPSPSPVPESPSEHKYNVSGTNGTCLLASMGLQLNITYKKKDNTVGSALRSPLLFVHWSVGAPITSQGACVSGQLIGTQPYTPLHTGCFPLKQWSRVLMEETAGWSTKA